MRNTYSFVDLQREMQGVKLVGRTSFSGALKTSLGEEGALNWFYCTKVPELKGTPHQYVEKHGREGKALLASSLYALLTGQPD